MAAKRRKKRVPKLTVTHFVVMPSLWKRLGTLRAFSRRAAVMLGTLRARSVFIAAFLIRLNGWD